MTSQNNLVYHPSDTGEGHLLSTTLSPILKMRSSPEVEKEPTDEKVSKIGIRLLEHLRRRFLSHLRHTCGYLANAVWGVDLPLYI
ncbi:hypothetical protein PoB_006936500 [Plakobranchus ocellatus]|uniref:Uncharacterized protein n=1 Tax=Plakobranchus ocellatus TaxID=259542 RepID=A0AAV4DFU8_9GAST|nr:hypothetical protein PoB_006936500 [Plakobranchus ocellatus]